MLRFGPTNNSPGERGALVIETPIGYNCDYFRCVDPILPGESGYVMPYITEDGSVGVYRIHRDCYQFSLGIIGIDHKAPIPHEPNSPKCNCNQWVHRKGT